MGKSSTIWHPRFCALLIALGLYACLSSPTPNNPGIIEIMIALLLIGACAPGAAHILRNAGQLNRLWIISGVVLLFYGLTLPLLIALLSQNDVGSVVRDVVPFLYLFLPLFLGDLFLKNAARTRILCMAFAAVGAIFAMRSLGDFYAVLSWFNTSTELAYFANSPAVLMASCLSFYLVMLWISSPSWSIKPLLIYIGAIICLIVTLSAMALTLQRASLGWFTISAIAIVSLMMWQKPSLKLLCFVGLVGVLIFLSQDLATLFSSLMEKTRLHGLNMRVQEWEAVWLDVSDSPLSMVTGKGWGATFLSPATDMDRVNFTHSLLSAIWLKTGAIGVIILMLYLSGFCVMIWSLLRISPVFAVAISGPVLISALLYGSYKSLDFGIMLLLCLAAVIGPIIVQDNLRDIDHRKTIG